MKALVYKGGSELVLEDRHKPVIVGEADCIVRVALTGICGTDRSVLVGKFDAKPGTIMGHETVGTVIEAGPASRLKAGARVLVNPTLYCRKCSNCLEGREGQCSNKQGMELGIDLDGGYAEFLRIDDTFLYEIPADVSFNRAVLFEPLACVLNNVSQLRSQIDGQFCVIGGGPMGLLTALLLDYWGLSVTLVESDSTRRGLDSSILRRSNSKVKIEESIYSHFDYIVDSTGAALTDSIRFCNDGGAIVVMGFNSNYEARIKPLELVNRSISIIGNGDFDPRTFNEALKIGSRMPLELLISHEFNIDDFDKALKCLAIGDASGYSAMKVVIKP